MVTLHAELRGTEERLQRLATNVPSVASTEANLGYTAHGCKHEANCSEAEYMSGLQDCIMCDPEALLGVGDWQLRPR